MNEPEEMRHIEGAMCGLPLLLRNSGALLKYCPDRVDKIKKLVFPLLNILQMLLIPK